MALFRLNAKSYFDQTVKLEDGSTTAGVLLEAGTVIDFDGIPGTNMDPVDDVAKAAHAKALKLRRDGLRPLTKLQELELADENPMLTAEDQRLSRQFRAEAAEAESRAIERGKIEMRPLPEPTRDAPQGKPHR